MTGPVAGSYAQARINECLAFDTWPLLPTLSTEVEGKFHPVNNVDWSCKKLMTMRQGVSRTEEFMAKFSVMKTQAHASDDFAIFMLEKAVRPEILEQIYVQGLRQTTYVKYEVEAALEALRFQSRTGTGSSNGNFTATGTQPGLGVPMDISAARQRGQKGPICYNCQEVGHIARNCRNPHKEWARPMPVHPGRQARVVEEQPADECYTKAPGF